MSRYMLSMLALCLIFAGGSLAVELAQSPVNEAMYLSVHGDDWEDDVATPDKNNSVEQKAVTGKKSVAKAAALSALVPGAGEFYLGNRHKAKYFFAADALTWIGFFSFRTYSGWKEDDYVRFAATNAGARIEDRDDEFRDLVGFYDDIDQYNTFGRVFDPDRPYLEDTPENHWRWTSQSDKDAYRHLKNRSREAKRRSEFMLGIAVLSRVVSIIDAIRDARHINKRIGHDTFSQRAPELKLDINPFSSKSQVRLTILTDF